MNHIVWFGSTDINEKSYEIRSFKFGPAALLNHAYDTTQLRIPQSTWYDLPLEMRNWTGHTNWILQVSHKTCDLDTKKLMSLIVCIESNAISNTILSYVHFTLDTLHTLQHFSLPCVLTHLISHGQFDISIHSLHLSTVYTANSTLSRAIYSTIWWSIDGPVIRHTIFMNCTDQEVGGMQDKTRLG